MKYNRILSICSSVATLISLLLYSIFGYVKCIQNSYMKDISLAVFGSALLLLISSIVGYFIEKKRLQDDILSLTYDWNVATDIHYEIEENGISKNTVIKLIDNSYHKLMLLHHKMRDYHRGLPKKDDDLYKIISDMRPHAEYLTNLSVRIRHPRYDVSKILTEINVLLEKEEEMNNRISKWMDKSKFTKGEPFNIDVPEEKEDD